MHSLTHAGLKLSIKASLKALSAIVAGSKDSGPVPVFRTDALVEVSVECVVRDDGCMCDVEGAIWYWLGRSGLVRSGLV